MVPLLRVRDCRGGLLQRLDVLDDRRLTIEHGPAADASETSAPSRAARVRRDTLRWYHLVPTLRSFVSTRER